MRPAVVTAGAEREGCSGAKDVDGRRCAALGAAAAANGSGGVFCMLSSVTSARSNSAIASLQNNSNMALM
jgi:hypothetical protein